MRCPICKKPVAPRDDSATSAPRTFPFCSERCKLFDLADWADGKYRVPGEPVEDAREDDDDETS